MKQHALTALACALALALAACQDTRYPPDAPRADAGSTTDAALDLAAAEAEAAAEDAGEDAEDATQAARDIAD